MKIKYLKINKEKIQKWKDNFYNELSLYILERTHEGSFFYVQANQD